MPKSKLINRFPSPNTQWIEDTTGWVTYTLVIALVRILFAYTPFLTNDLAWTITNVAHSVITFVIFHWIQGDPFDDSGKQRKKTFWEQVDGGVQFSPTRKFLTAVPLILFFLGNYFSQYTLPMFLLNFVALVIILIPKFPLMHKVRLFGINKVQ